MSADSHPSHVTIAQAARLVGVSYTALYERVKERAEETVQLAGVTMVPFTFVEDYIRDRTERAQSALERAQQSGVRHG